MWKAILVLFVMTEENPMAMMARDYGPVFRSQADCMKFAVDRRQALAGSLDEKTKTRISTERKVHILSHTVTCVLDDKGAKI